MSPNLKIAVTNDQAGVGWNAGIAGGLLETTTNLVDWTNFSGSPAINTNWQNVATDSVTDARYYRLRLPSPASPPPPLVFEAESLPYVTNGATADVSLTDTNASGGLFTLLNGDAPGEYIEFTVTNVPAGTYRLKLAFVANATRGKLNLAVDGNPLGSPLDEYWPTAFYPLADFGPVTFAAAGDHNLRLTVAGKSVASSGYTLTADKFVLLPQ